jgi:DNA polymerase-1
MSDRLKEILIDGDNLIKRNYMKRQDLFSKGEHCGGSYGFMDSLRSITDKTMPDRVCVFWDGIMSGKFRKDIYPNYKGTRENKSWEEESYFLTKDEIDEEKARKYSILNQKIKVKNYLEELCVRQVEVEYIEADDLLAYYVKKRKKVSDLYIYSSDKDFLQLVDEGVSVIRPSDGQVITVDNFKQIIGYTHKNALFFKCFEGDDSDNIEGVKGVGEKSLKKYYPRFFEEKYTLDMIIKETEELKKEKKLKLFDKILGGVSTLELNRKLMNLKSPMLNQKGIDEVEEILDCLIIMPDEESERGIKNAMSMFVEDGYNMHVFRNDLSTFFRPFYRLVSKEKEYSQKIIDKIKR